MREIRYYLCDGSLQAKEELNNNNIGKTNGMMKETEF